MNPDRFVSLCLRVSKEIQWPRKVWKLLVELPSFTRGIMGEWLLRKAVKSREGNVAEFIFFPVIGIE